MKPEDITIVYSPSMVDAAVYENGNLIDSGHADDVTVRLIERLGVMIEYNVDFTVDKRARGWAGVAKTLDEVVYK